MSKALMVMCCFFNMGLVAASRLFVRWASYRVGKADKENDNIDKRVLIVGAGDAGNIILRDLLERDPIQLDMKTFGKYLQGKTVLVTGAGGSIGSEICRQVLRQQMIELNKMTGDEEIIAQMQKMIPTYTPNHFSA